MSDSEKIASKKESNNFTGITGISLEKEMKNTEKEFKSMKEKLQKEELEKLFAEPHRNDEAIVSLVRKHFEL